MIKKISLFICILFLPHFALTQSSYYFQNTEIKAGTKRHFMVPVVTGHDSTFIPVSIFNGIRNGKTLGITAGVHGYEYAPILAAQKLINSINPSKLNGVVILVQIAGLESYLGRSPYTNPIDGKNLNRSFPGSKDGTNTQKIANFITEQIISRSDYFCDMHSGDAPEDMISYAAYYANSAMPEISTKGKEMAFALGFDRVVIFDTDGKNYMQKDALSLFCTAEAFKRGIPAIDIECGRLGIVEQSAISKIETSILNLLNYLSLTTSSSTTTSVQSPTLISRRIYTTSKFDGIFYPSKKAGDYVKKGAKLGHITSYFGDVLQTIYAEEDGMLLLILATPPISKGEDVTVLAKME